MSLYNRRNFLTGLVAMTALAGCGFTPVYGTDGAAKLLRGTVSVAAPKSREDYEYARAMTRLLGAPQTPKYALSYDISSREDSIGLTLNQEINRYHVVGKLTYRLSEVDTGKTVASGSIEGFTGYAATSSPVAANSASRDAYDRLMQQLADRTLNRLVAALGPQG